MVTPSRITLARERRGFSASALAKLVGVARQTVAAWESGTQEPTPANMESLRAVLAFPVSFFEAPDVEPVPIGTVSFRAMSKMTASTRDVALASGRVALLINEWLDQRYRLPPLDLPTLGLQKPSQAAEVVRHRWGLGNAPIANMTHLLESKGVRVFSLPPESRTLDAFSLWWFGTPIILLAQGKTAERRRFDLAHELGHLVLHSEREAFQGQRAEDDANAFASSFLMPRAGMLARPLRNATLDVILNERKRWRVAAMALTYRLNELGFLSEWQYRSLCVELSRRGFRSGEPGGLHSESSLVLTKVFNSLPKSSGGVVAKIADDLCLTPEELAHYLMGLVVLPLAGQSRQGRGTPTQEQPPTLRLA
jgi:Zn-dependent peptidase ImmA (M78 family)/transcriptional regulator with XRE-family HTH domain